MTRTSPVRRRSPPALIWLTFCIAAVATAACLGMGVVARQEAAEIQALQAEVAILQNERQTTENQLIALQSTATVVENRLAMLEANDPAQQLALLQAAVETADDSEELATLRTSLAGIQAKVDGFQSTLDDLADRIEALDPAQHGGGEALPLEAHLNVLPQKQSHNLSCEASASSMVAQYYGLNISEADVLMALPQNANPHLGFRGNVDGPFFGIEDYGVYAGPILAILNSRGLRAWSVEGGLDAIKAAIARGNPVIAWITYDCLPSTPVETTIDGKAVTLVPKQHVVVVTGYDSDGVWAIDPYDGREELYPIADFERAMGYFGDMAIEVAAP